MAVPLTVVTGLIQLKKWFQDWWDHFDKQIQRDTEQLIRMIEKDEREAREKQERQARELREKLEARRAAVTSLLDSLHATQKYLGAVGQGTEPDPAEESEIADMWHETSVAFLPVDADMALLWSLKSESWSRQDKWPRRRVEKAKLSIRHVAKRARKLIEECGPAGET